MHIDHFSALSLKISNCYRVSNFTGKTLSRRLAMKNKNIFILFEIFEIGVEVVVDNSIWC